ncbi:recombinase RecT [Variovorax sp. LjRoot130]|uniref:RecT family recombinase n=1 Tax=unclassified Variovorax TaxID=663243 RepID=UPI003ECD2441
MTTATAQRVDLSAVLNPAPSFPAPARVNSGISLIDSTAMDAMYRFAEMMASGRATVPKHLQGNIADCMAVALQAQRWGMSPFVVAKKTYVVDGNLGYEAQLVAAVVNTSSLLQGRLKYQWFGPWEKIIGRFKQVESRTKKDDFGNPKKYMVPDWRLEDEQGLGVTVSGLVRGEEEWRELTILMTQARTRNSTLWAEDPRQQIAYLCTNRWARLHTPELILGVYTPDELSSSVFMGPADVVPPQTEPPKDLVDDARAAADKGRDAFADFWKGLLPVARRALEREVNDLQKRCAEADAKRTVENPTETPAATAPAAAPATAAPATNDAPAKPTGRTRPPAPAPKPTAAPAPSQAAAAPTGAPVFTAATVEQRLKDAPDLDALYIAADLINHVQDANAVPALEALFEQRQAVLGG